MYNQINYYQYYMNFTRAIPLWSVDMATFGNVWREELEYDNFALFYPVYQLKSFNQFEAL